MSLRLWRRQRSVETVAHQASVAAGGVSVELSRKQWDRLGGTERERTRAVYDYLYAEARRRGATSRLSGYGTASGEKVAFSVRWGAPLQGASVLAEVFSRHLIELRERDAAIKSAEDE